MNGTIYIIKNKINSKIYIGQTIRLAQVRFNQHCKKSSSQSHLITRAISSYGKENFFYEILETNIETYEELNAKEEYYIESYKALHPNGYNLSPGGAKWRKRPKLDAMQENEVIEEYLNGFSAREIGLKYNINHKSIFAILDKHDIERRKKTLKLPNRTSIVTEEIMIDLYLNKKMKIKDIASDLGVCNRTINEAKRRYGLCRI